MWFQLDTTNMSNLQNKNKQKMTKETLFRSIPSKMKPPLKVLKWFFCYVSTSNQIHSKTCQKHQCIRCRTRVADRLVKIFEQCDVPWRLQLGVVSKPTWMYVLLKPGCFVDGKKHFASWCTIVWEPPVVEKTCGVSSCSKQFVHEKNFLNLEPQLSSVNSVELCGNAEKLFVHTSFCFNQGW